MRPSRPKTNRSEYYSPLPPISTVRDLEQGAFFAYNLAGLLHAGSNTIAIRLDRLASSEPPAWPAQIAVDGELTYPDGTRSSPVSDGTWSSRTLEKDGATGATVPAVALRPARYTEGTLPALQYRGLPSPRDFFPAWIGLAALVTVLALLAVAVLLTIVGFVCRRGQAGVPQGSLAAPVALAATLLLDALVPFTTVLAAVLLLRTAFGERSEQLWFYQPDVWRWSMYAAVGLGAAVVLVRLLRLAGTAGLRKAVLATRRVVRGLPQSYLWAGMIASVCLLGLYLRARDLDFQPVWCDEYASMQAIFSIERTGVPSYEPAAVWYTRSPLFHYMTAGVVRLFGENIWALRLPATAFGVGTMLLIYFCGSRLLGRPWVGLAAMLLATFHPHMVFASHEIRFYPQQQFFSLLMFFCFCKGFVLQSSQGYRYLTLATFLAAAMSQEITSVAALQLLGGYLLFARNESWRKNRGLIVATACVVAVIGVDWLVFQTHCLTRLEGYGRRFETALSPHFWEPYNFLSMFLGYSRVHVVLTALFVLGLPAALRERNRVTLALHFFLISGVVLSNLMVTQYSLNYQFWLLPLLLILAVDNARAGLVWLTSLGSGLRHREGPNLAVAVSAGMLFVCVPASWSLWRCLPRIPPSCWLTIPRPSSTSAASFDPATRCW